jgi:uncharacterized protein (DUF433 family)
MTMSIAIDRVHINRVLAVLQQQNTRCPLEAIVRFCPDLTREQIFLAIDCLIRNGQVCVMLDINGTYLVTCAT